MSKIGKQLAPHLNRKILAYTAVAGAAAACAVPSTAEVVYTAVNRPVRSSFFIDLNHDGIYDFHIYSSLLSGAGVVEVFPARGNTIVAEDHGCSLVNAAAPLPKGTVIGPGKPLQASATCMAYLPYGGPSEGPWKEVKHHYLGFAFVINGKEHFGWARMSLNKFLFNYTAIIEGYAYETIPGKPIIAGDEGKSTEANQQVNENSVTLGTLALGATGLNAWRK
jgi:hypothetical protein